MEYAVCVIVPFTNGVLITMGMSKRSAVPKHTDVGHTVCLYHVAVDTFPFTSMEYIILRIARCLSSYRLKN